MSGMLLDTNVLSELRKGERCDAGVRRWFAEVAEEDLFVSVVTLGEIRQGIERIRLRDPAQAVTLERWLMWISGAFGERLLPIDRNVADLWGRLGLRQSLPALDAFLAATALARGLTVVSRDSAGYRGSGVEVLNPFSKAGHGGH